MNALQRLQERFWFVPAVLCLTAFVLAETLIAVDNQIGADEFPEWVAPLVYRVGESGSREILSAIASSSLSVAGTTFSITIAVLALTSSTYGPRLVRNFMADRGNQTVLGVFVATFLYSLLVLRSVRVPGDPGSDDSVFVPHLAVNTAVVLAVANIGVLVYFIHHISSSIQIWSLASGVRADLRDVVDRLYPEELGADPDEVPGARAAGPPEGEGRPITADEAGYVRSVGEDALMTAARKADVALVLAVRPGEFVLPGTVVAYVHPPARADERLCRAVRSAVDVANARSPRQDVEFAVQQLTEMAVRALSPGTNDPYTAKNALDDLSVGLAELAARELPPSARFDDDGVMRVWAPRADVAELVTPVLDGMRWYATAAPSVMHATLGVVERIGGWARSDVLRDYLARQVPLLQDAFASAGHHAHDVAAFGARAEEVLRDLRRRREESG